MADVQFNPESKDIDQLQGQGLRAYVLQDYETACRIYSNVSELLVEKHQSDVHDELGDVYLNYGKSLLELSRREGDALNDGVIKNVPDDDDDDNGGGDEQEEENGDDEEQGGGDDNAEGKVEEEQVEKKEDGDKKEENKSNGDGANAEAVAGTSAAEDSVEKAEEADEDAGDLQLAWEVLELAKQIFTNRGEAGRKPLAETLVVLGEVALESGNYKPGIEDMTEGLRIQKSLFPEDSRVVAETSFILGGAYSSDGQIDQSIASYEECLRLLEKRLANLKAVATADRDADEIEEIAALIPDVREKVADMLNFKEEIAKREAKKNAEAAPSNGTAAASSSKQASDISHLVKRKRKSEEPEVAQPPSKKPTPEK